MNEIVAAFIVACSNLSSGGYENQYKDNEYFANRKSECIERISKCAVRVSRDFDERDNVDLSVDVLRKCAKEVHL